MGSGSGTTLIVVRFAVICDGIVLIIIIGRPHTQNTEWSQKFMYTLYEMVVYLPITMQTPQPTTVPDIPKFPR